MSYPEVMSEVKEAPVEEVEVPAEDHPLHRELNATDRCETCGAQAWHLVIVPFGGDKLADLTYCNHHFNKYDKIKDQAVYISSQLEKMNIKASASSPD